MISRAGNEALIVLAISQGLVVPCVSAEILREYLGVLKREKFGFSRDEVEAVLGLFKRQGVLLEAVPTTNLSPDPGDDKFIACALTGKADFLVTGNKKHFPQLPDAGPRIVNSAELLEFITLELGNE
jgi:putative PIN family toxin of toxin-antitoxin system